MIEKNRVEKNFSKNTATYDRNAIVQAYMAEELINFIDLKKCVNVLELGCGTGIFSLRLTEKYHAARFKLMDISGEMIEAAKIKLAGNKIEFEVGDAEKSTVFGEYDLIAGNAVIQWFNNPEETLKKYYSHLSPGGEMVFSTFGENTFYELRNAFGLAGMSYDYSQKFYSKSEIEEIAERNKWNIEIQC